MPIKKIIAFLGATFLAFAIFAGPTEAATYTVAKGDSLFKIAQKHGMTVAKLKTTNNLKSNTIQVGQKLTVPTAKVVTTKKAATSTPSNKAAATKSYKTIKVSATAYTAYCSGCSGITATGINLKKNPNKKVIAVDPRVIPLGSKVWVEGYGEAIAGDTGGAIKGNKIDVFLPTTKKALNWGRRTVTVKVYR
ncbi:3D domain-containing protein [Caryophanon tenue]|uniref:3D domain-containing protein n=1 Tax=Caryophanon tenue TaxID=33978 RepID=UPI000A5B4885